MCSQNGHWRRERRWHRTSTPHVFAAEDEEDADKSAGGSGSTGIVFHCKGDALTLLCFKSLVRLGMANTDIHSSGHGITNFTGDAGSSFALTCLPPKHLGAKDTGFEIDMADNANGIIIGKLVKALPTFRAVA